MRPEYLVVLGERLDQTGMDRLEQLGLDYTAGKLPSWFYKLWLTTQTVPLYKTAEQEAIRPLGTRHSLTRLFHKEVMNQSKAELREYLEPQQLGQSQGGADKLVNAVRGMLELHPDWVCVATDIMNCYNEQKRVAILTVLQSVPVLQHLTTFAASNLVQETFLEAGGKVWGTSTTGQIQGDPVSGGFQAAAIQPSLVKLDSDCGEAGGMARGGADDVFAVGPPEVVIPAIERFAAEIRERCQLQLQWSKSVMYCKEGVLPLAATPGLSLAGELVEWQFLHGLMVYGVPVGSDEYVTHKLKQQMQIIVEDAEKARALMGTDRQALWACLRLSVSQRFQYLMRLVPPSLTEPVAAELDSHFWRIFEAAVGFPVPRGEQAGGLLLLLPEVPRLSGYTFQEWAVRLPARLCGWGFRSLEDSCGPAYIGSMETAIPFMAGQGQVCPQLAEIWGGEECWGDGADKEQRWRRVLESGCRDGIELQQVWGRIRLEAAQAAQFLGEEVPKALSVQTSGVGEGQVDGSTRNRIVTARESIRAKLLAKLLKGLRPKSTRAAWAWRQRDKVSTSWTLALPGGDKSLNSAEFSEAAASFLCLPSPACVGRVGETVRGRVKIDVYGDNLQATSLVGDHWRKRHDSLVQLTYQMCLWAGVNVEMEVFNLFSGAVR